MALSSQQQSELEGWLALYVANVTDLDARVVDAVQAAYADVDDWFNPTLTLAAATTAAANARAGLDLQSGFMTQFLAGILDVLAGVTVTRRAPTVDYPRRAEPFDVYSRPVFTARETLRAVPDTPADLLGAADYAAVLAETDALLARRDAALAIFDETGVVNGYRRVIRPELSETGTCGLCIAAAARLYKTDELMPIHTRCKCTVLPIVDGNDPAAGFNIADLEALYAATPGTSRRDLAKTRYRIRRDGELGPLLIPSDRRGVPRLGAA
ncbi:hypothetical protein GCM10009737_08220 [Nocardioides lentus]|uniref:Phage head morphogenesis domain-containing protein n=1 Tax=Nocardioides lentus TaxID=338077 RepID=A0ABP5ADD3_9ACTN